MRTDHHDARLAAFLDGELAPSAAAALAGHVRDCEACRTEADDNAEIQALLAGEPTPLPEGFAERVTRRAITQMLPIAPLWWLSVPRSWRLGLASLFVLAAIGGVEVGRHTGSPAPSPETLVATLASPEIVAMRSAVPAAERAAPPATIPLQRTQP
ncbi:MAG: zf-HC2 domain-containing protein [Acidobacteria bacterium]|nr:zf-HC2 domain-containing protein [Acidobacteriota bacterium]